MPTKLLVTSFFSDNVKRYDGTTGVYQDDFLTSSPSGLKRPSGLAYQGGKFYVASFLNSNVVRFNSDGTLDTIFATGNGLTQPNGLAFDTVGKLYIANTAGNNVLRWNPDGTFDRIFATGNGLTTPQGMAFDSVGRLYVTSHDAVSGAVLRWTPTGTFD